MVTKLKFAAILLISCMLSFAGYASEDSSNSFMPFDVRVVQRLMLEAVKSKIPHIEKPCDVLVVVTVSRNGHIKRIVPIARDMYRKSNRGSHSIKDFRVLQKKVFEALRSIVVPVSPNTKQFSDLFTADYKEDFHVTCTLGRHHTVRVVNQASFEKLPVPTPEQANPSRKNNL